MLVIADGVAYVLAVTAYWQRDVFVSRLYTPDVHTAIRFYCSKPVLVTAGELA